MKGPSHPHVCKLYGDQCQCHHFVGALQVNGASWDVWSLDYGASVMFRWGSEGSDYYAAKISEFPLHSAKSTNDRNLWTKDPTVTILNRCWERVRNYFKDNLNQRKEANP